MFGVVILSLANLKQNKRIVIQMLRQPIGRDD